MSLSRYSHLLAYIPQNANLLKWGPRRIKQAFFDNEVYFEATKKHLFCFFLRNYLHIQKKCCTFAPAFVINPSGTTSKRTTNEDY